MQHQSARHRVIQAAMIVLLLAGCAPPSSEPAVSATPAATVASSPGEAVQAAITDALGDLNRDGTRIGAIDYDDTTQQLTVTYALNDNLSTSLIRTGAWRDVADIIRAIRDSGVPVTQLKTFGTMGFLDNLGNSIGEQPVVTVVFDQQAIDGANLDNLPGDMLESAALSVKIHPELQE